MRFRGKPPESSWLLELPKLACMSARRWSGIGVCGPQTPIPDQRRALMQASLGSSSSQDDSGGLPLNLMNGGQQISPEQMQQLISAYGKSGMQSAGGQPDLAKLAASLGTSNASPRLNH